MSCRGAVVAPEALSVVTLSVRCMPSMIRPSQPDAVELARREPVDADTPDRQWAESTDDGCICEECQAPSRDEMWSRWA